MLPLCFCGFFPLVAFETLASLSSRGIPGIAGDLPPTTLRLALSMVVFLVFSALSNRVFPLKDRKRLPVLAVVGCSLGGLLVLTSGFLPAWCQPYAPLVGVCLEGLCLPVLKLYWLELYASLDMIRVAAAFSLSQVLSSLTIVCISPLDTSPAAAVLIAILPLLSLFAFRRALARRNALTLIQGETANAPWKFPVRLVVVIGLFAATNTIVRAGLPVWSRGYAAIGVAIVMVLVFVAIVRKPVSFDVRSLALMAFPLMAAGPLCLITGFYELGALCTNAAFAAFTLFVVVALCATSFRYGANPLWLFGFAFGITDAGKAAATAFEGFEIPFLHSPTVLCGLTMLIVVLFAFVMAERNLDTWGVSLRSTPGKAQGTGTLDTLVDRCMRLSRIKGLTRREEEILFLLAEGDSATSIASQLFIAESTVRVHVKHIYAKLGVHSKQELQQLMQTDR